MANEKVTMSRRATLSAAMTGLALAALDPSAAQAGPAEDKASLEKAVEAMRQAMLAGDDKALNAVLHDDLSYSHSDGRLQNKAQVLADFSGKKPMSSIELSEQTVTIVSNVGVVRHVFDAVNQLPDGTASNAHIKVLQTWIKDGEAWRLLARASTPVKK
jgi:ketosteroid isomerase-like protein